MPTTSPALRAGGFTSGLECKDRSFSVAGTTIEPRSPRLDEKVSPAYQLRGTGQHYLAIPTDSLCAARRYYLQWRLGALGGNRSYRGSAGAGAGRMRFADAALEDANFDAPAVQHPDQFNVDAMFEIVVLADFRRFRLPAGNEIVDKHDEMRVAHGHRDADHFAKGQLNGERIADLRLAHGHVEVEALAFALAQR